MTRRAKTKGAVSPPAPAPPRTLTLNEDFGRGLVMVSADTDRGSVHMRLRRALGEAGPDDNPTITLAPMFMASPTLDVGQRTDGRGMFLTLDVEAAEDFALSIIDAIALGRRAGLLPPEAP